MIYDIDENKGLLALIGNSVYQGLCFYNKEIDRCDYLNSCYGRNQKSNVLRAIVENHLFKLGKANTIGILSQEDFTEKQTSYFLKMSYNDELLLTTFRLQDRTKYPKDAVYRGNYAKSNQLLLFQEQEMQALDNDGKTFGIICFGIDKEGIFGYIGFPDENNRQWLHITRLEDYFTDYIIEEEVTNEILPKLKVVQVAKNGS